MPYKGEPSPKTIARDYPFVVEILVPLGGLGTKLDRMHAFHRLRGISDQHVPGRREGERNYLRWCFRDRLIAESFASEFSGTLLEDC